MNQIAGKRIIEATPAEGYFPEGHYLVGNRIPRDYFVTSGIGESDITIHAGSYHLALKNAGIEMCNIITYSSILPGIAREIEKPRGLTHGSVMESIMAVSTAEKGGRATWGSSTAGSSTGTPATNTADWCASTTATTAKGTYGKTSPPASMSFT